MFIGEYNHSLDDKGRMNLPAKFRRLLQGGIVITRSFDRCLTVYPRKQWEELAEKLAALPISSKQGRAFSRLMLAGAWDAEVDSQGRVAVPEYLRDYAQLKKHVVVAGLYNRMEIWDEDGWQTYKSKTENERESIAEAMGELGI